MFVMHTDNKNAFRAEIEVSYPRSKGDLFQRSVVKKLQCDFINTSTASAILSSSQGRGKREDLGGGISRTCEHHVCVYMMSAVHEITSLNTFMSSWLKPLAKGLQYSRSGSYVYKAESNRSFRNIAYFIMVL